MTYKKLNFKAVSAVLVLCGFTLSGCNVLQHSASSLKSMLPSQANNTQPNQNNALPTSEALKKAVEQNVFEERLTSLEIIAEDWQESKPAINRLAALESDLSFIIEQIESINSGSSIERFDEFQERQKRVSMGPNETQFLYPNIKDDTNENTWGNENQAISSPLPTQDDLDQLAALDDEIQKPVDKFYASDGRKLLKPKLRQTVNTSYANTNPSIEVRAAKDISKFRTVATEQTVGALQSTQNCNATNNVIGSGYAIHIASFKSKNMAVTTLKQFYANNAQLVCGKTPLLNNVLVNNQSFYSLRLGPYAAKPDAIQACDKVKQQQSYCAVTSFAGEKI